jgi:hypothetical protein
MFIYGPKLRLGKPAIDSSPPVRQPLRSPGAKSAAAQQAALLLPVSSPRMRAKGRDRRRNLLGCPPRPLNPESEIYLIPKLGGG